MKIHRTEFEFSLNSTLIIEKYTLYLLFCTGHTLVIFSNNRTAINTWAIHDLLKTPIVAFKHLNDLFKSEILFHVEHLVNLFRSLPNDHVNNSFRRHVQKASDLQAMKTENYEAA